eukprot:g6621.t1
MLRTGSAYDLRDSDSDSNEGKAATKQDGSAASISMTTTTTAAAAAATTAAAVAATATADKIKSKRTPLKAIAPATSTFAHQDAGSKKDKFSRRLDAESSIGVSAALIGGFSLTLLGEADNMGPVSQWIFVVASALCGALGLWTVVMTSVLYWGGQHVLSATRPTVHEENRLFKAFWENPVVRFTRTYTRICFQLTVPFFFIAMVAWVWKVTANAAIVGVVSFIFTVMVVLLLVCIARVVKATRSGALSVMA